MATRGSVTSLFTVGTLYTRWVRFFYEGKFTFLSLWLSNLCCLLFAYAFWLYFIYYMYQLMATTSLWAIADSVLLFPIAWFYFYLHCQMNYTWGVCVMLQFHFLLASYQVLNTACVCTHTHPIWLLWSQSPRRLSSLLCLIITNAKTISKYTFNDLENSIFVILFGV